MRPVLLEMAGFASFREPTVVDFRGAEYFALVGPTGSGKSTVIDALTFALYGSVPRWDNVRTVSLALAPTVLRGTVRFVFDVGGARYVVAREVRRAASGSVSVRSARLERLRDATGTGASEEETEPLADGAAGTTTAVEELLGLPFGDFTTCVVLPQGEFAEFLHTEPRKRQEKLVRILGLGVYDVIARDANSEAAAQGKRAEVLTEQLGGYADATPEAEQYTAARVAELAALAVRVEVAVPELTATGVALGAVSALVTDLRADHDRLVAVAVPGGLDDLDTRRRRAATVAAAAADAAVAAEAADTAAREQLATAPERGPLEKVRRDHAELAALVAELPGARERQEKARAAEADAARDATDARDALDAARAVRDTAAVAVEAAFDVGRRLTAERDALRAREVPVGLDALDRRRCAADVVADRAAAALIDIETAENHARTALAAAPPRAPLEQARRDHRDLARARAEHGVAGTVLATARRLVDEAADRVVDTARLLDHARAEQLRRQRADLAATLRPALAVGEQCPVCAQPVAELPAPVPDRDSGFPLAEAEQAHEEARQAEAAAAAQLAAADVETGRLDGVIGRLLADLAAVGPAVAGVEPAGVEPVAVGPAGSLIPSAEGIGAALAALDRLAAAAEHAGATARTARTARESAAQAVEGIRAELGSAVSALRSMRDPLVPLGAPSVEDGDVVAGWTALVGWAAAQAAVREEALPGARAAATVAQTEHEAAGQALRAAQGAAQDRRRDETAAARAEQEARGAVEGIEGRTAELRAVLDAAPTGAEALAALARLGGWEAAARTADTELRATREALRAAERSAALVGLEVTAAWESLRSARDPLVRLGAPAAAGDDLLAAWTGLTAWAGQEAAGHRERLAVAETDALAARDARDAVARILAGDLAEHDVVVPAGRAAPVDPPAAARSTGAVAVGADRPLDRSADIRPAHTVAGGALEPAPDPVRLAAGARTAVAAAHERARGAHERIAERRAAAGDLLAARDAAESVQQVAKLLGNLLRSDGFPRWLVASALDTLVADASTSLAELSGGQFELTHDNGEFLVVDHTDADARRPVKTLSGGETFQASLALALALSAQMSGLAARGAARLESIFLDEGFGTLDEANLEVVAGTLENLATRGDRVVGVITHVAALAERVPVRFTVSRDQRTSLVLREGL